MLWMRLQFVVVLTQLSRFLVEEPRKANDYSYRTSIRSIIELVAEGFVFRAEKRFIVSHSRLFLLAIVVLLVTCVPLGAVQERELSDWVTQYVSIDEENIALVHAKLMDGTGAPENDQTIVRNGTLAKWWLPRDGAKMQTRVPGVVLTAQESCGNSKTNLLQVFVSGYLPMYGLRE